MDAEWIKSPTARRILMHFAGPRPAWLWSRDGVSLIWRNPAARLFNARIKKSGLKLQADAVPIKGQVARLIRLGSPGRSSLSRVQFLADGKPLATTCSVIPLILDDGEPALLLVAVDPVPTEVLEAAGQPGPDPLNDVLFPPGSDYLLVRDGRVTQGSAHALAAYRADVESIGMPEESAAVTRLPAGDDGAVLLVYPPPAIFVPPIDVVRADEGEAGAEPEVEADLASTPEPMLPMGISPIPAGDLPAPTAETADQWVEPMPAPRDRALSSLFDRLADDATLYAALSAEDEVLGAPKPEPELRETSPEPIEAISEPEPVEALPEPESVGGPPDPDYAATVAESDPQTRTLQADSFDALGAHETSEPAAGAEQTDAVAKPESQTGSLGALVESTPADAPRGSSPEEVMAARDDIIAAVIEYADDPEEPAPSGAARSHWMITGRGFRKLTPKPPASDEPAAPPSDGPVDVAAADAQSAPLESVDGEEQSAADVSASIAPFGDEPPREATIEAAPPVASFEPPALAPVATIDEAPDAETAERVSRYNFAELGRILTDRVASEPRAELTPPDPVPRPESVINLNAETLVLNRLPIAILVFRDQQVLFANRALTDLLGHDSVESLRAAGIASIFPNPDSANAGPVNQLVRRDNVLLPVTARLQSVSWQGRAALMLSATPGEPIRNHEVAVRGFAELAAEARDEGFVAADRTGRVTQLSGLGRTLLGLTEADPAGKPLAALVGKQDLDPLRTFLEKPARFAETARPALIATSDDGNAEIALFAEGQAGVVSGYFGFVRKRARAAIAAAASEDDDLEPSMLARLSRGVRRPLNTIIGFADLIRSASAGQFDSDRYAEYGRDIRTAGLEIAVLVDELDDFTRLQDGRYAVRPSDVDLTALLESCMTRVKTQAGGARVLVRSAISEQLPRIRADRTSLGQALLNLLASAIDQTPIGGSVILSAQAEESGGVAIHVRDGAQASTDLAERFVVFRDGVDKDGEQLTPVRSSVGLALTRSLLAVNACSLSVDPMMGAGTLFSLLIPADLVAQG